MTEFQTRFDTSEQLLAYMASQNDTCLLSFSRGKDAIASYIALRPHFKRIIPYYYYQVPGLEFVEESLAYYERVMGCRIARFPAPATYNMLRRFVYQPPNRVDLIDAMRIPQLSNREGHDAIQAAVCADAGVDYDTTYNGLGVRASDSVKRRMFFQTHGHVNLNRRVFYPIFDWNKDRLVNAIRASGIKLPIDYTLWTSSFDGLRIMYLIEVKRHFPRDYQRILEWFPFAEMEVLRYEASLK